MDTRAYLQWRIETHQAAKELALEVAEKAAYVLSLMAMAGLWIVGWMFG